MGSSQWRNAESDAIVAGGCALDLALDV